MCAREIYPTNDHDAVILVNDQDYEWLNKFTWQIGSHGYVCATIRNETVLMHRMIVRAPKGMVVDHKDRDPLNNTRENLRVASYSQNNSNRSTWGRTGYRGVFHRRDHFVAQKRHEGEKYVGYEREIDRAARLYDALSHLLCGEFAALNFPGEPIPQWALDKASKIISKKVSV